MLGSQFIFIKVLSDDFADVDVREDLCYHSRPKKQNSKGEKRTKDECRKAGRGGKSGSRSQAVQRGRLRHRRAFRSGFPIFFGGVGLSAAARSAAALVIDKLTPNCHLLLFMSINIFWKCLSVSELLVKRPFVTKSCSVHSFKRCVMKKAITVMRLPFNMIRN